MKVKCNVIFMASMLFFQGVNAKIRLLSMNFNRPEYIPLQYKSLKKFLKEKDDFELIIFNDASNKFFKDKIAKTCRDLGIECVEVPQSYHHSGMLYVEGLKHGVDELGASTFHCEAVQYALDTYGYDHDDIVGILEEDVFMLRDFSIRDAMENYDILGIQRYQQSINTRNQFLWIGLVFINMKNLPHKETLSFDLTWVNNVFWDSGGSTYYYLKNNPQVRVKYDYGVPFNDFNSYDSSQLRIRGFSDNEITFIQNMVRYLEKLSNQGALDCSEFYFDYSFVHQCNSRIINDQKTLIFKKFLNAILR